MGGPRSKRERIDVDINFGEMYSITCFTDLNRSSLEYDEGKIPASSDGKYRLFNLILTLNWSLEEDSL